MTSDFLAPQLEKSSVSKGLEDLSLKLDMYSTYSNEDLTQAIGIPEGSADRYRFYHAQSHSDLLIFTNRLGLSKHKGLQPEASIYQTPGRGRSPLCYEIKSDKEHLFLVVTQDQKDNWNLWLNQNQRGFRRFGGQPFPDTSITGAQWTTSGKRGIQIKLEPVLTEIGGGKRESYHSRFSVTARGGDFARIRSLPTHMTREALDLPQKPKNELGYPPISEEEMNQISQNG